MPSARHEGVPPCSDADDVFLNNLTLSLGSAQIYRNISLTLPGGQTTCLLGPSGVGKSSLLRQIAGLVTGNGDISVGAAQQARPLPQIAYMGQTDLLFPWLTALENVLLGSRLRRQKPDTERAQQLLTSVGLPDIGSQRPDTLSGGMRQRVALARTMMEDRPIILMDEPFSAVDALTRRRLQDLTAELLAGRTILLVTHDPWEAVRLGHKIVVMSGPENADLHDLPVPTGQIPRNEHEESSVSLHAALLQHLMLPGA